jgi:hypothetical protein
MTTDKKVRLLTDVRQAVRALCQLLDGGHDLSQLLTFSQTNVELLRDSSYDTLAGLAILDAMLTSEIGTDNL